MQLDLLICDWFLRRALWASQKLSCAGETFDYFFVHEERLASKAAEREKEVRSI